MDREPALLDLLPVPRGEEFLARSRSPAIRFSSPGARASIAAPTAARPLSFLGPPKTFLGLAAVGSNFLAVTLGPPFALYRSTDSGSTWVPYGSGFPTTSAGFVPAMAVNGNTVIVSVNAAVARSLDGGATWTLGTAAPGVTAFAGLAFAGNTLWGAVTYGTASGVFRSDDNGATWTRAANGPLRGPGRRGLGDARPRRNDGRHLRVRRRRRRPGAASTTSSRAWTSTPSPFPAGPPAWARFPTASSGFRSRRRVRRLVPVVLDVAGVAHYTTELTLTNRGTSDSQVTLPYTASLGSGTGTANEILHHGSNLVIPDVIAYLQGQGAVDPERRLGAGRHAPRHVRRPLGAGRRERRRAHDGGDARAAARRGRRPRVHRGRSGPGVSTGSLTVYGLRSSSTDRSNLAVYNTTADPVTVQRYGVLGRRQRRQRRRGRRRDDLPAWGWTQFNRILDGVGFANGWVTVDAHVRDRSRSGRTASSTTTSRTTARSSSRRRATRGPCS